MWVCERVCSGDTKESWIRAKADLFNALIPWAQITLRSAIVTEIDFFRNKKGKIQYLLRSENGNCQFFIETNLLSIFPIIKYSVEKRNENLSLKCTMFIAIKKSRIN